MSGRDVFLEAAVEEARQGWAEGGIPIGAVLVHKGNIIGRGRNQRVQRGDPILHAELHCLQSAGRLSSAVYRECTLYSTLSPCSMCSGAVVLFKIPRVVVGENINYMGAEDYLRSHGVQVDVVQDPECVELMCKLIDEKPGLWNEDIGE